MRIAAKLIASKLTASKLTAAAKRIAAMLTAAMLTAKYTECTCRALLLHVARLAWQCGHSLRMSR